jgi:hypothetical protein
LHEEKRRKIMILKAITFKGKAIDRKEICPSAERNKWLLCNALKKSALLKEKFLPPCGNVPADGC